jgi:response regulator RpfG family c-di-GMP phosphodiesterase
MRLLNGASSGNGNSVFYTLGPVIDTTKRYVLVVEDNKMMYEVLVAQLKTMGVEAVVAENGKVAIEKFQLYMHEG